MDALIVSIAIAITLGLAASAKDESDDDADDELGDIASFDRSGEPDPSSTNDEAPADLKPAR